MSRNLFVTYPTGEAFDPLRIRPEQLHARDIGHHLSIEPRYCGGTRVGLSVAEHSLAVSWLAAQRTMHVLQHDHDSLAVRIAAQWGLMHEGFEMIAKDQPRGLKARLYFDVGGDLGLASYSEVEETFLRDVLAPRFGLPWPIPSVVGDVDREVCGTEMRQLCRRAIDPEGNPLPPAIPGVVLGVMSAAEAETRWIARFVDLWGAEADDLLGVVP